MGLLLLAVLGLGVFCPQTQNALFSLINSANSAVKLSFIGWPIRNTPHMPTGVVLCSIFSLFVNVYSACAQSETIFRPGPGLNNGADNGSVSAGKDTLVSGSGPTVNYGSDVSTAGSPVSTCNTAMARAYIQFDLSTLPSDVQQVFLGVTHFPHTTYCYSNCNADFYFYPVSAAWDIALHLQSRKT